MIASKLSRSAQSVETRWKKRLDPYTHDKDTPWTPKEDALLLEIVQNIGFGKWTEIGQNVKAFGGRLGYSIRERFNTIKSKHLKSELAEEDVI